MKIHYTSGEFYIEKDGKKIKIANPKELPFIDLLPAAMKEGDSFDLPKELSVEIKDACDSDCCTMDGACGSNCRSPLKVAHLSKSSSPEIPDSSEKVTFEKALELELNKLPYTKHLDDGGYNDGQIAGFELGASWAFKKFSLYPPSPPTVAGTSTEPYKTNDSKISNSSDAIVQIIIDKLFNGNIAGPFEYNDVRELANDLRELIRNEQEKAWDKAFIAFQKNNPKTLTEDRF